MWRVWQIVDAAFPVGGFAHSAGLEATWQLGELSDLRVFCAQHLWQQAHGALPFVSAAHAGKDEDVDARCDVFLSQHIANRASRTQGRAFLSTFKHVFGPTPISAAHFAPVFGACLRELAIDRDTTRKMFLYTGLRGVLSAAVRLGLLGPHAAQRLQLELEPICQAASAIHVDVASQIAPVLEVHQGAHDRLYSRLFQS